MSNPAITSRSFSNAGTPAALRLLQDLYRATPLYLLLSSLQAKP